MRELAVDDAAWRDARTAVFVFNAGEDVLEVAHQAYTLFILFGIIDRKLFGLQRPFGRWQFIFGCFAYTAQESKHEMFTMSFEQETNVFFLDL